MTLSTTAVSEAATWHATPLSQRSGECDPKTGIFKISSKFAYFFLFKNSGTFKSYLRNFKYFPFSAEMQISSFNGRRRERRSRSINHREMRRNRRECLTIGKLERGRVIKIGDGTGSRDPRRFFSLARLCMNKWLIHLNLIRLSSFLRFRVVLASLWKHLFRNVWRRLLLRLFTAVTARVSS